MSFVLHATGAAQEAIDRVVPQLVADGVAGRIAAKDSTLWGEAAEAEASKRLGWIDAASNTRGLVDDVLELKADLAAKGVDRFALAGMGGSSLAPEVITRTFGVHLTVLDSTEPGQVLTALRDELERTAIVVSSKSGSTLETDSAKRVFEQWYREAGIDPTERIIVVTDPGSPLDGAARAAGYRVFNADPNVGGRYSALTAFGIVPSALAGVDVAELLDEAEAALPLVSEDDESNPGLQLGAVLAGTKPLKDYIGIVADGTHIVGFADWAEQLIAESTGKQGTGVLPVVLDVDAAELGEDLADLQVIRVVGSRAEAREVAAGEVEVAGTLGAQLLVWEFATAVAGRLLGIDPFDQPDVESAKDAREACWRTSPPAPATVVDGSIELRGSVSGDTLESSLDALLAAIPADGYLAVHTYLDRLGEERFATLRDLLAARTQRPVTFGWGPRFLHSTGQYHKGGKPVGVFLQILGTPPRTSRSPSARSRSASCCRRRLAATPPCSRATTAPCSR
ncbi:glucose-6-phosphate isomerase [Agrococcus jejuensis]|uniref:Glucose-6-phosphate isomerase n=1 Tax=Agrococcus jejuensis TaxID=399736 RepID=A0A1G7ZK38_9MICO|nr:glucose-6-phosphate isomerase [Agrococcus jejuensis]